MNHNAPSHIRAEDLTALLTDAPTDAADHEAVRKYVRQLADAGLSVLFIYPGSKVPADLRTPAKKCAAAAVACRPSRKRRDELVYSGILRT